MNSRTVDIAAGGLLEMNSHCAVAPNARCHYCEGEKDEAVQIQQSLLPVGGLKDPLFEIACRFSPFAEVGDDFEGKWGSISATWSAKGSLLRFMARW